MKAPHLGIHAPALLAHVVLAIGQQILAGSPYSDFDSGAPRLFGTAAIDASGRRNNTGGLKIAQSAMHHDGSHVIDDLDQAGTAAAFTVPSKLSLVGSPSSVADGLSFNFAADLPNGVFPYAQERAGTGISVCFDAFDNGEGEAPVINSKYRGSAVATNIMAPESGANYNDVWIVLNPSRSLDVQFGGTAIHSKAALPDYAATKARFGFGERIVYYTDNQWLDDLSIDTDLAEASGAGDPPDATLAPPDGPKVKAVYLIPSDKEFNSSYASAISNAMVNLQGWYRRQMKNGKTFWLNKPVVAVYHTSHPAAWYRTENFSQNAQNTYWLNATDEGFALTGGRFYDPDNIWVFYLDADTGGQNTGAVGSVALLHSGDLMGLVGHSSESTDRWIGGSGHELGHAFGLPHPPGCEDSDPNTDCPTSALMWFGYTTYPTDAYLLSEDRAVLNQSRFFATTAAAPLVTLQPQDQQIRSGGSATFSVSAFGALSYQWQLNGVALPGATNRVLTLSDTQLSQAGYYSVNLANNSGVTTSSSAVLAISDSCSYSISPSSASLGVSSGSGSFGVTTGSGCSWSASTTYNWIHTSSGGVGNGTVDYTVDANSDNRSRIGTITVQNQTFSVMQAESSSCSLAVLSGPITNSASGHQYYLLEKATWMCSEEKARGLGGHLVTINDAAESEWITSTFGSPYFYLWIGLNDAATEGVFVWSSGESVSYRDWYLGEPNDFGGDEDYVLIYSFDSGNRQWNDMGNVDNFNNVDFPIYGVVEVPPPPQPATLTVGSSPSNGGFVTGGGSFAVGSPQRISATPANGWLFVGWSDGNSQNPRTITVPSGGATYVANFAKILVTIALGGSPSVGGTVEGGGSFDSGTSLTVTARPGVGYAFVNWTEDGAAVSTSPSYQFTAIGNRTLVANFAKIPVTITLSASPSVGGAVEGGGSFDSGTSLTATARPGSGYAFVNWTEDGAAVSTSSSYQFTAIGNRTLVANFAKIPVTITLSASPSVGGAVEGGGSFDSGTSLTATARPGSGYAFVNWTEDGAAVSTSSSYQFTAIGNRTLVANFAKIPVTITLSASPSVGGAVEGGGSFDSGTSLTATARPGSGYAFVNWTEDGAAVSTSSSYQFTAIANRTLVANFAKIPVTITLSASPNVGGTVEGGGTFDIGTSVMVTARQGMGYAFVNWTEGGTAVNASAIYQFTASTNRTLVANFEADDIYPPNDNLANRFALRGPTVFVTGHNTNATKELGEPSHASATGGKSVWWSWTAPESGLARISLAGSSFDTVLGVYAGSSINSLVAIATNDDASDSVSTSLVEFPATEGTEYEVAVDGFGGAFGKIEMSIEVKGTEATIFAALVGNEIVLSWDTKLTRYVLESAKTVGPGAFWDAVTPAPVIAGGSFVVTNRVSRSALFYRLHKP